MTRTAVVSLVALTLACVKVPNPHHLDEAGSETLADEDSGSDGGDGDGDPGDGDGDPTGDGDGDPGDGDGDGEPTGDGDGDSNCVPGAPNCPCGVLETCQDGLACVLGNCVAASSCAPVNDGVSLAVSPTWGAIGEDPPAAPTEPYIAICALHGQVQGNQAVLQVQQCGGIGVLQQLVFTIQPIVEPLEQLLGNPNLAATVTVVETPEGFYLRIEAKGMELYYASGTSLFGEGVTTYPWPLAPFSSSCGQTPTNCGPLERLALLVDGGILFDGNAGQATARVSGWAETVVDDCGVSKYEVALLGH